MPKSNQTILSVAPSARELGVAVFCGESLLYYGVKTVKATRQSGSLPENVGKCVSQLLADYEPDYVAFSTPATVQQQTFSILTVAEMIRQTVEENKIEFSEYRMSVVRRRLSPKTKSGKREIAKLLASRFPELERYLYSQNLWQYVYYARIFDAVAIGLVCLEDVNKAKETSSK